MTDAPELPVDWRFLRVGDCLKLQNGYAFKPTDWTTEGDPIIRIQNLNSTSAPYNHFAGELPERFRATTGDLLFAWSGTPGTSFGAHVWTGPRAWVNQHIFRVDFDAQQFDRDFLRLALNFNLDDYIVGAQGGVGLAHITKAKLNESLLVVPPMMQQQQLARAVGHAEESKSRAIAYLLECRRAVERFRQSVLAAACSGRLTAEWREAHPNTPSVEPALARLEGMKSRRKKRQTDSVDLELPLIADSYVIATVAEAATAIEYGTSRRAELIDDGVPVLRMGNIQGGQLDLTDLKYCARDADIERLLLEDGDLLFNRTNSPELVGKSAVFHEPEPMTFASYLIRVQLHPDVALPDFVSYWINSAWGRLWARHVKTDGVSQSNINGTKLGSMPLPLPPIAEQHEIVRKASRALELSDELLERVARAQRQLEKSSRAVLAKAFRGELSMAGEKDVAAQSA